MSGSPVRDLERGHHLLLKHGLARVRPLDQVNIPEPVQVGLPAIELDDSVIPALVVHDGVEGLVQVRHEVHDPVEGLLADGAILGRVLEQPDRLLDGRDDTGVPPGRWGGF